MSDRRPLIIILAAGKGTRMKSAEPKVLHAIAGRSLIGHVMAAAAEAGADHIAVVVGPGMDAVAAEVRRQHPAASLHVQQTQLGTADAVRAAGGAIAGHAGDVIVLFGDTPLMAADTIRAVATKLNAGSDIVVVGFEAPDPAGYGRLLTDASGKLEAIREHKDASEAERRVRLCNSGVMGFRGEHLGDLLDAIGNTNAKGEYYLTDTVAIGRAKGLKAGVVMGTADEVLGVNDRGQLAAAEAIFQARKRREVMAEGATLIAPETVYFSFDTSVGRDVVIEPYVVIGPGVTIADRVSVRAFSHITGTDRKSQQGTQIGEGAEIGPYARLRPGAAIGKNVHIGNFVEVKNVTLEEGAKANHLTYLGDGRVGRGANIGAGTIFCNYDGFNKHFTDVGAEAFIGSNAALVAPVKIGDGAFVGSGSVITRNVAPGALALERSVQEERPGWAAKFRQLMGRKKKAKSA